MPDQSFTTPSHAPRVETITVDAGLFHTLLSRLEICERRIKELEGRVEAEHAMHQATLGVQHSLKDQLSQLAAEKNKADSQQAEKKGKKPKVRYEDQLEPQRMLRDWDYDHKEAKKREEKEEKKAEGERRKVRKEATSLAEDWERLKGRFGSVKGGDRTDKP